MFAQGWERVRGTTTHCWVELQWSENGASVKSAKERLKSHGLAYPPIPSAFVSAQGGGKRCEIHAGSLAAPQMVQQR